MVWLRGGGILCTRKAADDSIALGANALEKSPSKLQKMLY
jgi:hypothetical protein